MHHSYPESEPNGARLLFIELLPVRYSSEYRHLQARVIRRAVADRTNPDTLREEYNDGREVRGYRHCDWSSSKKGGLMVRDLALQSQMTYREINGGYGARKQYGCDYKFRDLHVIDRRDCERMANTFKKLDAGMNKIQKEFGYLSDEDFAGLCVRVAKVLGIKKFVFLKKPVSNYSMDQKELFHEVDVSYVPGYVEELIDQVYGKESRAA